MPYYKMCLVKAANHKQQIIPEHTKDGGCYSGPDSPLQVSIDVSLILGLDAEKPTSTAAKMFLIL